MDDPPQSSLLYWVGIFLWSRSYLRVGLRRGGVGDVEGDVKFRDALYRYSTKRIAEETEAKS